jgi:predicted transcriptional regulator
MGMDAAALKQEIEAKHGTVYKFIKQSGLPKSAVYWLLSGHYPSEPDRLLARIREALSEPEQAPPLPVLEVAAVAETLASVACSRCKRLDRRRCRGCKNLFRRQAEAIEQLLRGVDNGAT